MNSDKQAIDPLKGHPRYTKVRDLSSGSFGFVQLVQDGHRSELVAVKFIHRGETVSKYVEAEVLNHRMLRHPHVVEFKDVFLTAEYICIAMEFASGGSLFQYVQKAGRLKETAARWFFQQLMIGLDYCHQVGVVNRDVKLENTLLQIVPGLPLPLLKICDFGYSKAQAMSAPKSKVGTLAYMAPEVIRSAGKYDGKLADVWSCGVMLYVMLFGAYPFDSAAKDEARMSDMMTKITNMQWQIPTSIPVSPECADLLRRMIIATPAQRITIADIQRHPWFLVNLPPDALRMNDACLRCTDYSGVQSEAEIKRILQEARTPGALKYDFAAADADEYEDLIEEAIESELLP